MAVATSSLTNTWFVRTLHRALRHLYDPSELRKSPLLELFGVDQQEGAASALRRILIEAIEALKPGGDAPPQSNVSRLYRALAHRYVEQFTQTEVAEGLAISSRQLRRLECLAVQTLADNLWVRYGLQHKMSSEAEKAPEAGEEEAPAQGGALGRERELEWLRQSFPSEAADVSRLIQAVLVTANPLMESWHVQVDVAIPTDLPRLAIQPDSVRQALLNTLTAAIRAVPEGRIQVVVEPIGRTLGVFIQPIRQRDAPHTPPPDCSESLEMAKQLAELSGGSLEVAPGEDSEHPFVAKLLLPIAEKATVLMIDDNVDTLQLYQRYLAGTRYPFSSTRDPQQGLELAQNLLPSVILLDVMLPGIDGWQLLGRLRAHPQTRDIPVIVCTILPEEQLALALGAAAFIRKPVSRVELLRLLDAQVGERSRGPH